MTKTDSPATPHPLPRTNPGPAAATSWRGRQRPFGAATLLGAGAGAALLAGAALADLSSLGSASLALSATLGLGSAALLAARRGTSDAAAVATRPTPAPGPHPADPSPREAVALEVAAVFTRTLEGTIRYWSGGAARLFGFSAEEAIGRPSQELLRTRFMEGGRRALLAQLLQSGEWQGELRQRRRDGRPVTVATNCLLRVDPATGEQLVIETSTEATAIKAAEEALRASEGRLRLAQEVAGVGSWEWDADGEEQDWSREQHALFGTDPDAEASPTMERLLAVVHEDDRAAVREAIARGFETGEYEAEFRIRRRGRDGAEELRWLIGRGRRMPGRAGRHGVMLGVHVDITARKENEERQMLLIREVDHRAKNALAVVQAVLRLTRTADQASYVRAVEGRVAALARAQSLLTASRWMGADLHALIEGELAPFLVPDARGPRVVLDGPRVQVSPVVAQPLSMAMHELATNAVKHGALGAPGGTVQIGWAISAKAPRRLEFSWVERGGPPIAAPPGRTGFGGRVLRSTIQDQLGGVFEQHWEEGGMQCRFEIAMEEFSANRAPPGRSRPAGLEGAALCP